MKEAKSFRTFIRVYSLFKSECLNANFKQTLHKALIRSVITYAYPSREFAAGTHLSKWQRLQKKVLCTTGKFPKYTAVHEFHMAFQVLYIYDYIMKLCRQQEVVIQNNESEHVHDIRKGGAQHRKYKRLKLGCSEAYDRSSD
jgi:hypothetical protein